MKYKSLLKLNIKKIINNVAGFFSISITKLSTFVERSYLHKSQLHYNNTIQIGNRFKEYFSDFVVQEHGSHI